MVTLQLETSRYFITHYYLSTGMRDADFRIPAYAGMTVRGAHGITGLWMMSGIVFTLTFDSSPIKGEGVLFVLFYARPLTSGLRIKSAMTVAHLCEFPRPVDTALKPV